MDFAETLGYAFGYRNMKKAEILDPNAQKKLISSRENNTRENELSSAF